VGESLRENYVAIFDRKKIIYMKDSTNDESDAVVFSKLFWKYSKKS